MADRSGKVDLNNDNDLETDFVYFKSGLGDKPRNKFCPKDSVYRDTHLDSGLHSAGYSLESSSLEQSDKLPVQCTDTCTNDIVKKLDSLNVEDDEGISLPSLRSCDSDNSQVSMPEEIEVDLFERDDDGDTVMHVAILNLMNDIALALIDLSVDSKCLNIQNYILQAPIHLAVLTGQVDIVRALIDKGADVTLRDQQGNTPLHIACRKGDRDSVSIIVQSFGQDVSRRVKYFSLKNCEGLTCAHVAAQQKEFIILGHLFAKGADVNIGDAKSGRTMLHYAVEKKDVETVSLLLTHPNIDVDCRTFKGETPLVLAYWRNYQNIVKRLKAKGAFFSYNLVEDSDDESYS